MTGLQITMIIIGFVLIIASYMISEKVTQSKDNSEEKKVIPDVDIDVDSIKEKIETELSDAAQNYVDKADEELAKESNEKIMAFHEYSQQILDKIDQNHKEVVFLYDMLNQKDEELKETLRLINNAKKDVENLTESDEQNDYSSSEDIVNVKNDISQNENDVLNEIISDKNDNNPENVIDMEDYNEFVEQNSNEQILKMYETGSSIVEISKKLGIGQGEVKLVINLYKGVNGK